MTRGQSSFPRRWLIADTRTGEQLWDAVRSLPSGSGVLLLHRDMPRSKRSKLLAKLRRIAAARRLVIADEVAGDAVRVHDLSELRAALARRVPMILLSPLRPTASHPDWTPIPRMRAAAMAQLAGRRLIALGGMDESSFALIEPLGFRGWAAIGAYLH